MPDARIPTDSRRAVADVMRRHFMSLTPEDTLVGAVQLMRLSRVRTLPVLRGEHLAGFLRHRDLLRELLQRTVSAGSDAGEISIDTLPWDAPGGLAPEASLRHAVAWLAEHDCGLVAVVERDGAATRLLGILTENDLLRVACERRSPGGPATTPRHQPS